MRLLNLGKTSLICSLLMSVGCAEVSQPTNASADDVSATVETSQVFANIETQAEAGDSITDDAAEFVVKGEPERPSWPNWRGPKYDGISRETGWSPDWTDGQLETKWTKEIGIGFSSCSTRDGKLFTMGHVKGTEFVYCLDLTTGDTIWTHSYPCKLVANLYEGGPGSTPTIDGDCVYTIGKEGQLFCLDFTSGKVNWQVKLQEELSVGLPEWGFASSPYILKDQLLLEGGRLASFDKKTGKKNWQTEKHTAGYGTPISFQFQSQALVASLDSDAVRVVSANDGKQLAEFPWTSPFRTNSTTPIVKDDTIYISTAYNVGCGLMRFTGNDLDLVYDNRLMRNHFNNSVLVNGTLYGFDGNSNFGRTVHLVAMDFETGKLLWKQKGLGCGSVLVADETLIILSEDGNLVTAKASADSYQEISRQSILNGRCWTVPMLAGGNIYARNANGTLVCVPLPEKK